MRSALGQVQITLTSPQLLPCVSPAALRACLSPASPPYRMQPPSPTCVSTPSLLTPSLQLLWRHGRAQGCLQDAARCRG